ncbi:MAG: type IV pilin-like G/H family protein [Rivularia sp. ALOHA_DT_140]|nr:type IV pilin-like G/H family protein [Rivularia sp. ALOHA_DT_140]
MFNQSKIICLLLLLINISGCRLSPQLSSKEIYEREQEGKSPIYKMNQAQADYLVEKNRFAKTFDELKINTDSGKSISFTSESAHYVFKIIQQPSNSKSVMHIAQPKSSIFNNPDLKSFMGVVYLTDNSDDGIIMSLVCKTSQSLSESPKMPQLTKKYDELECPSGFELSSKRSEPVRYKK